MNPLIQFRFLHFENFKQHEMEANVSNAPLNHFIFKVNRNIIYIEFNLNGFFSPKNTQFFIRMPTVHVNE